MSGGSYEYASLSSDLDDLLRNKRQLRDMANSIESLGYADDVARLMQEMLIHIRHWEILAESYCKKLNKVWYAYEWWQSGDASENQFKEELNQFRLPGWGGVPRESKKS